MRKALASHGVTALAGGLLLHAAAGLGTIAASLSALLAMSHSVLAALYGAGLAHLHAQRADRVAVGVTARNGRCG